MNFVVEFPFLSGWDFSRGHKKQDKIRERNFKGDPWLKLWKEGMFLFKHFENKDCVSHSLLTNALVLSRHHPWHLRRGFAVALFSSGCSPPPKTPHLHLLTTLTQTRYPASEPWTPLCHATSTTSPGLGLGGRGMVYCHSWLLVVLFSFELECNMKLAGQAFRYPFYRWKMWSSVTLNNLLKMIDYSSWNHCRDLNQSLWFLSPLMAAMPSPFPATHWT